MSIEEYQMTKVLQVGLYFELPRSLNSQWCLKKGLCTSHLHGYIWWEFNTCSNEPPPHGLHGSLFVVCSFSFQSTNVPFKVSKSLCNLTSFESLIRYSRYRLDASRNTISYSLIPKVSILTDFWSTRKPKTIER